MSAAMPDLVIRNATLVDGTGAPRFRGDLALRGDRIAAVGAVPETQGPELDARGQVLAPGFIDVHTHYDAQLCWDGLATPSPLHGVTTVCTGNCSLSLAPVRKGDARRLVGMFQTIEDIREQTFEAGVSWAWESFPEYLASIEAGLGVNVAPLVGHSALRLYAMGEAAQERTATPAELETMCDLVREAVAAGARGISTSYLDVDEDLRPVPSRFADLNERIALARAAREAGGSVLETVPQAGDPAELEVCIRELGRISRESGLLCTLQPIIYLPIQPELWRSSLEWIEQEVERGARLYGQSPPGPMSFNLRLDETFFTFFLLPSWGEIMRRPVSERAALFADPSRREALRAEGEAGLALFLPNAWIGETYSSANQGLTGRTLAEVARERGQPLVDALIEISLADGLHTEFPIRAAMHGPEEIVQEILAHPNVLVGASDAGAHLSQFCGAGDASYFLAEYVRRRKVYSLEAAIHRLTGQPATLFELDGRGRLEVGAAADLVLFDPERIAPGPEVFVRDLPGKATRYVRDAAGVSRVWVGGRAIVEDGQYTQARPGRIV